MSMLKSFAPWITFLVLTSVADWRVGLVAGLAALIAVVMSSRPVRIGWLDGGMLVFFVVMGAFALARPDSGLEPYASEISTGWLAVVSLVSLLAGRPFTLEASGEEPTAGELSSPIFWHAHRVITLVWTAYFAISTALGAAFVSSGGKTPGRGLQILLLIGAIKFTLGYRDRAQARGSRTAAVHS